MRQLDRPVEVDAHPGERGADLEAPRAQPVAGALVLAVGAGVEDRVVMAGVGGQLAATVLQRCQQLDTDRDVVARVDVGVDLDLRAVAGAAHPAVGNQRARVVVPPLMFLVLVAQVALDLGHREVRAAEDGHVGGREQLDDGGQVVDETERRCRAAVVTGREDRRGAPGRASEISVREGFRCARMQS